MKDLAYEIAQRLFTKSEASFRGHSFDDGFGGVDMALLEQKWQADAEKIRQPLRALTDENAFLRSSYTRALEACEFIREEREALGLNLGQCIIQDGVPALRRQRDMLVELLKEGLQHVQDLTAENDKLRSGK